MSSFAKELAVKTPIPAAAWQKVAEPAESRRAGEHRLRASQFADAADLERLLKTLAGEDCAHSWRNFDPDGSLDELLAWENRRRPTRIFFFHLVEGGQRHLVAAAAVADRLTRDFPHPGFCVLGRCYVLPDFRSRGLYREILHYRLEHCRQRFGYRLRAIHIGSTDERIARVIRNHGLAGWPNFSHLGQEDLKVAREVRKVGAYLLFLPNYVRALRRALDGPDAPRPVIALREVLANLESDPLSELGLKVQECFDEARDSGWFKDHDGRDFEHLLGFCRAIPLVGLNVESRTCNASAQ